MRATVLGVAATVLVGCMTEADARQALSSHGLESASITISRRTPWDEDFGFTAENAAADECQGVGHLERTLPDGWLAHIDETCTSSMDPVHLARACETRFVASACADAARMFRDGNGVVVDYERSFHLAQLGCRGGRTDACFFEGFAYENALGTSENETQAIRSYRLACDDDDGPACFALGTMLVRAMPPDVEDALVAFARACSHPYETRACHRHAELLLAHSENRDRDEIASAVQTETEICDAGASEWHDEACASITTAQ